jgi:hypothetical protein
MRDLDADLRARRHPGRFVRAVLDDSTDTFRFEPVQTIPGKDGRRLYLVEADNP